MASTRGKGRPAFKITPEIIEKCETWASQGLTMEQIAQSLGIHQRVLYKKKADEVELDEAIQRGRSKGIQAVTSALFQKAMSGDNTAMIFYLKNRDPKRWADVYNHNNAHSGVTAIEIVQFSETDEGKNPK